MLHINRYRERLLPTFIMVEMYFKNVVCCIVGWPLKLKMFCYSVIYIFSESQIYIWEDVQVGIGINSLSIEY